MTVYWIGGPIGSSPSPTPTGAGLRSPAGLGTNTPGRACCYPGPGHTNPQCTCPKAWMGPGLYPFPKAWMVRQRRLDHKQGAFSFSLLVSDDRPTWQELACQRFMWSKIQLKAPMTSTQECMRLLNRCDSFARLACAAEHLPSADNADSTFADADRLGCPRSAMPTGFHPLLPQAVCNPRPQIDELVHA